MQLSSQVVVICRDADQEGEAREAEATLREVTRRAWGRERSPGGRPRAGEASLSLPGGLADSVGPDGKAACSFTAGGSAFIEQHWCDEHHISPLGTGTGSRVRSERALHETHLGLMACSTCAQPQSLLITQGVTGSAFMGTGPLLCPHSVPAIGTLACSVPASSQHVLASCGSARAEGVPDSSAHNIGWARDGALVS